MVKYPSCTLTFGNINPKNELAFIANWRKRLEFPSLLGDSNFYYPISGGKDPERDSLHSDILQNGIFFKKKKSQFKLLLFILFSIMWHQESLVYHLRAKKSAEKSVYKGQEKKTGGAPHWEASSLN